jgi:hypothetical protein
VRVAQNYFKAGEYEAALEAFRRVTFDDFAGAKERLPVRYMIATCLRKLGKTDEAAGIYRELAGAQGDPFIAESARWQLSNMSWKREMEERLAQLGLRNDALKAQP